MCSLCCNSVEDEYHFLCECTVYDNLRIEIFGRKFNSPKYNNLKDVLAGDFEIYKKTAVFITKAMVIRENWL